MTLAAAALVAFLPALAEPQRAAPPRTADDIETHRRLLAIEDGRAPTQVDLDFVVALARGASRAPSATRVLATRVLGRLERRDLIPVLAGLLEDATVGADAGEALLLILRAHAAPPDAAIEAAVDAMLHRTASPRILRQLPYTTAQQLQAAASKLMVLARDPDHYASVAAAFETLARRHRRLHSLEDAALDFLRAAVRRSLPGMLRLDHFTPRVALAALSAAGAADESIVETGFRDRNEQVRRTAVEAANAAGARVGLAARVELTRAALADPSVLVRYEGLRGWIRHDTAERGCGPLIEALADGSLHVVLAALDALGERCSGDESIVPRLVAEARTPPAVGDWQREAHAFVALAKRSPDLASTAMPGFIGHPVWQVRMYAARAAAAMQDVSTLERLAYDLHDNVREATLVPLRALKGVESHDVFIAALRRSDYQLLRTAATALEGAPPDKGLLTALIEAFGRVTAEKKDTSRDTRLALLERIRATDGREQLPLYERLLEDFDPSVANAAADACRAFSAGACVANPRPLPRPPPPTAEELMKPLDAIVEMDGGRKFRLVLDRTTAPLACSRFLRLVRAHYYDGLTFHRVVPNFVIQGGSPGANEYVGDGGFMRDEPGGFHQRGAVGISTRGRHTGDAQLFVNLVDNPRLDLDYTVFARVPDDDMAAVDVVYEGARIRRVTLVPAR